MIYKLQNGWIIKLQKGKVIPKLLQKIRTSRFDRAAEKAFKSSVPDIVQKNIEAGKIGWAPSQMSSLWHNSNVDLSVLDTTFPTWDVVERGAPLGHVWLSGSETTSGFLAKRPYRLIAKDVTIRKPLVQIGESIGDGKNVTRNEILDFAQKSSADGINFSGIADNQLQNQNIYALFKDVPITGRIAIKSRPISAAEKAGIPKGERSNPKSLEDPYYWGYQQWNSRYNKAVDSGNVEETQRLRDLHFKVKAPDTKVVDASGNPLHTYHGLLDHTSPEKAIKFNKYEGVNWDVEDDVEQGSKINHWKLAVPTRDIMTNYHSPNYDMVSRSYAFGYKDLIYDDYLNITNPFTYDKEAIHNIVNAFKPGSSTKTLKIEPARYERRPLIDTDGKPIRDSKGRVIWSDPELIPERRYYDYDGVSDWAYFGSSRKPLMQLGYDGLYIPQYYDSYGAFVSPSQFKSAEPITRTDMGEIIPIVKRDNFHNLDRRYKQGGKT